MILTQLTLQGSQACTETKDRIAVQPHSAPSATICRNGARETLGTKGLRQQGSGGWSALKLHNRAQEQLRRNPSCGPSTIGREWHGCVPKDDPEEEEDHVRLS